MIQFSVSTQFSSIWAIDRTLSGATTPVQKGYGSDGNGRVLYKAPALLEPHNQVLLCNTKNLIFVQS